MFSVLKAKLCLMWKMVQSGSPRHKCLKATKTENSLMSLLQRSVKLPPNFICFMLDLFKELYVFLWLIFRHVAFILTTGIKFALQVCKARLNLNLSFEHNYKPH